MAVDTPVVEPTEPEPTQEEPTQEEPKQFDEAYVKKLRSEAASYRTKLRDIEQKQKEEAEARLAEQQEWQTLAEKRAGEIQQLQPYKERYDAMVTSIAESNKSRIEAIPEATRSLVPDFDDPIKLAQWLDANQQLLGKPLAPVLNGNAGGGTRPSEQISLTPAEIENARKMGVDAKDYAKYKGL